MKEFSELYEILSRHQSQGDLDDLIDDITIRRALQLREKSPKFFVVDMSTYQAYVSDQLRQLFGFSTNLVYDFPNEVLKRIEHSVDRALVETDLHELINLEVVPERYSEDLYYRYRKADGEVVWIYQNNILIPNFDNPKASLVVGTITKLNAMYLLNHSRGQLTNDRLNQDIIELLREHVGQTVACFQFPFFTVNGITVSERRQDLLLMRLGMLFNEFNDESIRCYRLKDQLFGVFVADNGNERQSVVERINYQIEAVCEHLGIDPIAPCQSSHVFDGQQHSQAQLLSLILQFIDDQPELNSTYSESIVEGDQFSMRQTLDIVDGIQNNFSGFKYVAQPAHHARESRYSVAEILLRSRDSRHGISPGLFVSMIEGSRMIIPFGRHSLDKAIDLKVRMNKIDPNFSVAVNFSPMMLLDEHFFEYLKHSLEQHGLDGSGFYFELTESAPDKSPERTSEFLNRCRSLGIRLSLDDFGEGANMLLALFRTPFEVVKFSRQMALQAYEHPNRRAFMKTLIDACHDYGLRVCMEGIEDEAMVEVFQSMGVDHYQGYYFSSPMDFDDLLQAVRQQKGDQ